MEACRRSAALQAASSDCTRRPAPATVRFRPSPSATPREARQVCQGMQSVNLDTITTCGIIRHFATVRRESCWLVERANRSDRRPLRHHRGRKPCVGWAKIFSFIFPILAVPAFVGGFFPGEGASGMREPVARSVPSDSRERRPFGCRQGRRARHRTTLPRRVRQISIVMPGF